MIEIILTRLYCEFNFTLDHHKHEKSFRFRQYCEFKVERPLRKPPSTIILIIKKKTCTTIHCSLQQNFKRDGTQNTLVKTLFRTNNKKKST